VNRLSDGERWGLGIVAASFIVTNVAIAVFALSYWVSMGVWVGVTAVGLALVWSRVRGD
jgi:hypothetical protein